MHIERNQFTSTWPQWWIMIPAGRMLDVAGSREYWYLSRYHNFHMSYSHVPQRRLYNLISGIRLFRWGQKHSTMIAATRKSVQLLSVRVTLITLTDSSATTSERGKKNAAPRTADNAVPNLIEIALFVFFVFYHYQPTNRHDAHFSSILFFWIIFLYAFVFGRTVSHDWRYWNFVMILIGGDGWWVCFILQVQTMCHRILCVDWQNQDGSKQTTVRYNRQFVQVYFFLVPFTFSHFPIVAIDTLIEDHRRQYC